MDITPELASKLILAQFPRFSGLPIVPVKNMGNDNITLHLGEDMSVRLPSGPGYALQPIKEQTWIPYLQKYITLQLPQIVGAGNPTADYPYNWSIYKWLPGKIVSKQTIHSEEDFARTLGTFLVELHAIDATEGPAAGPHNYYRGGDLAIYAEDTQKILSTFGAQFNVAYLQDIWEQSIASKWDKDPVWVHGDLFPTNMLAENGMLTTIIDFGVLGTGDPACDLAMAWIYFSGNSRIIFLDTLQLDNATIARAKGWVLWKQLLIYQEHHQKNPELAQIAFDIITNL